MIKNQILIFEKFLDTKSIDQYLKFLNTENLWENNGDGIWNNRTINIRTMPENIQTSILDYRIRVKKQILDSYLINQNLYCDIFQFVKWNIGDLLYPPHADAEYASGKIHPFSYRNYSAITYLNDNYKGGEIYFTEFNNFRPKISPGTLIIFPGTLEYMHGVTEILEGTRYTIASFFTFDKTRHDGFPI